MGALRPKYLLYRYMEPLGSRVMVVVSLLITLRTKSTGL